MSDEYRNIYKTARNVAGYTQENAAERLDISVESLRAYENDQRTPPNEVVDLMVICYDAQYLAYQHLRESSNMARRIIPSLEERGIMELALRIHNRFKAFEKKSSIERLMSIAEDNVISPDERQEFDDIMADFRDIIRTGMEMEVHNYGKDEGR